MPPVDFIEAERLYRLALAEFLSQIERRRIDGEYRKAGRATRKALKRCFNLAAKHRLIWTPGDCRTFY